MLGAIIGDVVGSRFERHHVKTKEFNLIDHFCRFTDDSIMTLALGKAMLESGGDVGRLKRASVENMRLFGGYYPKGGYGGRFKLWLRSPVPEPYGSCGNGAAMRVSIAGDAAKTFEEAVAYSRAMTACTHNHPDGLLGAEAVAVMIFMARHGEPIEKMRDMFTKKYYPIDFTLDSLRPDYHWGGLCSNTVPQAMEAFFESKSFEDCIRNAVSLGGDSDTLAAIAGAVAEGYYGVPKRLAVMTLACLDDYLLDVFYDVTRVYPVKYSRCPWQWNR